MGASTIKHITSAIAAFICRNAFAEREAKDSDHQWTLRIVLREGSWSVLRMSFVWVQICGLITISTLGRCLYLLVLRQLCQLAQDIHEVPLYSS